MTTQGSNRLTHLAAEINAEHDAATGAFQTGIEHAIKAGELLIEAKKVVPHGDWLNWLQINCSVEKRMAQNYMKIARELPKLDPAEAQGIALLGVEATLNALAIPSAKNTTTPAVTIVGEYEVVEISDSTKPAPLPTVPRTPEPGHPDLPTKAEAKDRAREIGGLILARDGRYYSGRSDEELAQENHANEIIFDIKDGVEMIANVGCSAQEYLDQLPSYMRWNRAEISQAREALDWLSEFCTISEKLADAA